MQNIILIGMPGCGKSTIGQILSQKLSRAFVDTDMKIVEAAGKPITQIFSEDGEAVFRDWETKILAESGKQSGLVIATGGGCVTEQTNYDLLHQNGKIIWIQKDIDTLAVDGRPLSSDGKLEEMYQRRKSMYSTFSDLTIVNNSTPDEAANKILAELEIIP